eukprot:CAMPEP_0170605638 /NCGR_PEP_ID=MMETSP0224-20130122/20077_1 /TAXON_ID=285029 /ORGANISM="Togula jolla, Strain CCCM 725" /LENGTH=355 /DNA_ID=CAMNT_0010930649 /DNA_START=53 /DNA_END=1116 /DNA_ORIENTATION=-
MAQQSKELDPEVKDYAVEKLRFRDHFSTLLLSGDWGMTLLEVALLGSLTAAARYLPGDRVNVAGSMPLKEVAALLWTKAAVARLYNAYCEAIFFSFPQYRIQPPQEHALKESKDLCGRDQRQLEIIHFHDCLTLLSQFFFNVGLYYALPGFYPATAGATDAPHLVERGLKLVANHYVLSFGMYWMHRALHVVPWLWDHIHSYHHWAKHPLSRNTYQDHWLDNLMNAIVGHGFAQVLVPLDRHTFWFSQLFRIFESLEKHSGVSCYFNCAHSLQRWLPYAQMPHHHDWHHEGHKSCNYTFSALGGLWDCIFGTRKGGRALELRPEHITRHDVAQGKKPGRSRSIMDKPLFCLMPVV